MTTPERIDANRRNALKSTGPRTPHGKAIVGRNALRHGFRSRHAVLPREDPTEFHEFLGRLHAEFSPSSPSQEAMLDQMATSYWRLGRLQRIENEIYEIRSRKDGFASAIRTMISSDDTAEPGSPPEDQHESLGLAYIRDANSARALISLSHYEARLERSFLRAMHELNKQSQSSPLFSANRPPDLAA